MVSSAAPKDSIGATMNKTFQTKEIIGLYGKAFLAFAIPLGLLTFILLPGLRMLSGVFYGVVLSIFVSTMHIVAVRRLPFGKQPGALQVHQTCSIELKLPYDKVFNLCLEAILVKGGTIYEKSHERGKIMAKTGVTTSTWGNMISLNAYGVGHGIVRVMISSRPTFDITFVDYGSNLETVNNIAAFLKLKEEQALETV